MRIAEVLLKKRVDTVNNEEATTPDVWDREETFPLIDNSSLLYQLFFRSLLAQRRADFEIGGVDED